MTRRCSKCGFEWDGKDTECYNCESEETYILPDSIDLEVSFGNIKDNKILTKNLLTGDSLKRKLKERK